MSYDETLDKLGKSTAKSLRAVFDQWVGDDVDEDTAVEMWKLILEVAGEQGRTLGATAYTAHAQAKTGQVKPIRPGDLDVRAEPTSGRIAAALATVMDGDPEDIPARLERLGYSDPINVAGLAFAAAMIADNRARGWSRGVEADACELCNYWDENGRVYAIDHEMPTHPGCVCYQQPTFN